MNLSDVEQKLIPCLILSVILFTISFLVIKIGDPTKRNISNNTDFEVKTAFMITPMKVQIGEILDSKKAFIPSEISNIPWSFEQHAYWITIVVKNKQPVTKQLVIHFDNPMLDDLTILQVNDQNEIVRQLQQGDQQKEVNGQLQIIPNFDFVSHPLSEITLLVRIASTGISNTPINIYTQTDFANLEQKKYLLWGAFIGVSLVIGLYNLLLYFAIKDVVYLIYNAYIASVIALLGVVLGYGYYLFPEVIKLFFNLQVVALNCSVAIFALLFLIYFLKFEQDKKWQYWLAIFIISTLGLLLIVSLWLPEYMSAPLLFILMPFVYLICLVLILTKLRHGLKWGKLYVYSWIPLLIGASIQPLLLTGYIDYNFLSHHAFMISVLLEIVLMAMALADRMRFQEEQVIFHATHETISGLPNLTLLESHITNLLASEKVFATCLIEIENFRTLAPFVPTRELQKLQKQVVDDISPFLGKESNISVISKIDNHVYHLAKVADGRLMFIVTTIEKSQLDDFLNLLQSQITRELQLDGLSVQLKTQIGVCLQSESSATYSANEYIQHSLVAIDQNKDSGEQLHYYHDYDLLNIKEHLTLARDLQIAMRSNQLHLYHQPQINLDNGSIYGSEVLLRWNHVDHGFISPELFVRMAEDMGLINELTCWVIEHAFEQLPKLHSKKYLNHRVSINISGKDIGMPHFLSYIKEMMVKFNVPRDVITFELTESVMVTDFEMLDELIISLKELGINVSIDDYGTGYSSLNYISELNFDELKIDKTFVLNLDKSERNLTIVKTTIEMAKNLKLKVVAEGIESEMVETKLIENGCDIGQGFYYSKPLPFDKYLLWLENNTYRSSLNN